MRKYDLLTVHVRFLVENWIWLGLIRIQGGKEVVSSRALGREDEPNECQLDPKIDSTKNKHLVSSYSAV